MLAYTLHPRHLRHLTKISGHARTMVEMDHILQFALFPRWADFCRNSLLTKERRLTFPRSRLGNGRHSAAGRVPWAGWPLFLRISRDLSTWDHMSWWRVGGTELTVASRSLAFWSCSGCAAELSISTSAWISDLLSRSKCRMSSTPSVRSLIPSLLATHSQRQDQISPDSLFVPLSSAITVCTDRVLCSAFRATVFSRTFRSWRPASIAGMCSPMSGWRGGRWRRRTIRRGPASIIGHWRGYALTKRVRHRQKPTRLPFVQSAGPFSVLHVSGFLWLYGLLYGARWRSEVRAAATVDNR